MKKIKLREFANLSCLSMLQFTERRVKIEVMDDQEQTVVTDTWMMALTWFSLVVHRHFNKEPYHIDEVAILKSEKGRQAFVDDNLLKKPIDNFLGRLMPQYDDPVFYDFVKQLVFTWHNQVHNYMCIKSEDAVVSARAVDIVHVYRHPKVADLKKRVRERTTNLADAGKEFEQIMMTEPEFDKSVFGLLYRTRSVSSIQSFQLVIARGDVFDLNNVILPNTVMTSYADGITNLADSLGDSKGAGFSLISNGSALQDSEWFHKKIHNVSQVVQSVQYQTDCGSQIGPILKIISKEFKKSLAGRWRILEDGSNELLIGPALDKIETGDVIQIRDVAWCHLSHKGKPCSKCFGKMESALPYNPYTKKSAVPGLFYGSTFAEPIGQSILKTKHRIGSATSVGFKVQRQDMDYITTDEAGDFIYFKKDILNEDADPYIILDKETQQDFSDFQFMDSLDDLDTTRLRTYETIKLRVNIVNPMFDDRKATHFPILTTTVASRDARMTKTLVEYLLSKNMEEEGRTFKISLKDYDFKEPAFELPQVNEDLDAYRKRVENFLKFPHINRRWDVKVTPELHGETMIAFWKVVDEKYKDANSIMHSIFLWACMGRDPENLDYGIPIGDQPRNFVSMHEAILNRGLGNTLLYGWQANALLGSPLNFLIKNRQGGVLEAFTHPIAREA
ncbi:RNA polymerase beta' subunit [Pseudomonas phage OBP]|uniref:RNA polymerase beta subunit n=1 Tax=Pseudomonas phage OBP TaxID=1124849 RepID=UPI000240D428|nr:RNA polymerase beta subunit [Pseudomonas phage OBP]AEV89511.1 RNA polymerase beta' subunit [Pseudomonas phage OBP]